MKRVDKNISAVEATEKKFMHLLEQRSQLDRKEALSFYHSTYSQKHIHTTLHPPTHLQHTRAYICIHQNIITISRMQTLAHTNQHLHTYTLSHYHCHYEIPNSFLSLAQHRSPREGQCSLLCLSFTFCMAIIIFFVIVNIIWEDSVPEIGFPNFEPTCLNLGQPLVISDSQKWDYISCRWHHWSWMIACCSLQW